MYSCLQTQEADIWHLHCQAQANFQIVKNCFIKERFRNNVKQCWLYMQIFWITSETNQNSLTCFCFQTLYLWDEHNKQLSVRRNVMADVQGISNIHRARIKSNSYANVLWLETVLLLLCISLPQLPFSSLGSWIARCKMRLTCWIHGYQGCGYPSNSNHRKGLRTSSISQETLQLFT